MSKRKRQVLVRPTEPRDFEAITDMSLRVYPDPRLEPWLPKELASHRDVFPEGQMVAVDPDTDRVLGMTASLIVTWDDYDLDVNWDDFTACGMFTNHDPTGRTLYGAEVMVHPDAQGMGVGKQLYRARRDLVRRLHLRRIRAGARLRGYSRFADQLTPEQYVLKVIQGQIGDPTLSFQIKQGFRVIAVTHNYLTHDPSSQGVAAVIEWINHQVAQRADFRRRPAKFARPRKSRPPRDTT